MLSIITHYRARPGCADQVVAVLALHPAAEVAGPAADQELLGKRAVDIAAVVLHEQPECGAPGEQHLRRPLLDRERLGKPSGRRTGRAGQAGEQVELMGCGEGLEGPEAGRQLHQGDGRQCSIGVRGHGTSTECVIGHRDRLSRIAPTRGAAGRRGA